jgi:ABC-type branched-subunit amino acid transport system ATPase component/ABC-type branched-subunit amino acid transport system permease subunit
MIHVHGWDISQQMVLTGAVIGLSYSAIAAGLILVYRASGIVNFAVVAFGAVALGLFGLLTEHGWGFWPCLIVSVPFAALVAMAVEVLIIRRLEHPPSGHGTGAPRLVLLMATIGIAQLLGFLILIFADLLPDVPPGGDFPTLVPKDWSWQVSPELQVTAREISVLIAVPILVVLLAWIMTRTRFGLVVRAAAGNPDKARLVGISVARTSTLVWGISAAFTATTLIVLAAVQFVTPLGAANGTAQLTLGYPVLVKALLIAMIARMRILWLTVPVGMALGIIEVIFQQNVTGADANVFALWLFVATLVVVLTLAPTARASADSEPSWKLAGRTKPLPEQVRGTWVVRQLPRFGLAAVLVVLAIIPAFATRASQSFLWTRVLIFAIAGCSLTILSGWAGQLSLGQFGFSAIGGLVTVRLVGDGWFGLHNVPWGVAVALGVLVGAAVALVIGIPALRIPGLYLAVTTLAFAVFVENWLVNRRWLGVDPLTGQIPVLQKPDAGIVNFSSRQSYYYLCLGFLVVCLAVLAQLRRTGIGRTIIAVRDNERAAEAMTSSATRAKLVAFAVSGGIAALAGALYVTALPTNTPSATFATTESVTLVAIAVIGGLGSIVGPVLGAAWVIGLPTLFPDFAAGPLLVSSVGLLGLLLFFPGGFVEVAYRVRDALAARVASRLPPGPARQRADDTSIPVPAVLERVDDAALLAAEWLSVHDVTVRFGGLVAVNAVSLHLGAREIVGLIGANGAGKSSLMNAIGGFVPSTGTVEVLGHDVSRLAPYRRARVGLGRGFQSARLYDDLTVRETVLVALEARERTPIMSSMLAFPRSSARERAKRTEAAEIIRYVGLDRFADEFVSNLSTGTRRVTELACQLAMGARVLLLDEPTAGLAQRETEAFGPLIMQVRRELDAAVLLIEHDMSLVMQVSDRVYCLEAGRVIAEGRPEEVRHDPLVVATYLGTDVRSIQRSGVIT